MWKCTGVVVREVVTVWKCTGVVVRGSGTWRTDFDAVKVLKCGDLSSGVWSWYLQLRLSLSHAKIESSLKHVMIVLLRGRKNTWNK